MAHCSSKKYSKALIMEWFHDHFENGMSLDAVAEKYGIPKSSIDYYIRKAAYFQDYEKALDMKLAHKSIKEKVAMMKVLDASPKMVDQIVEIGSQSVAETPIQYQYAIQNAAVDILNRAGVKAKEDADEKEVHVVFDTAIDIGTPDSKEE